MFDDDDFDRYEWSVDRAADLSALLMAARTLPQLHDLMNSFADEVCLLLPRESQAVNHTFNTCAFRLRRATQLKRERTAQTTRELAQAA